MRHASLTLLLVGVLYYATTNSSYAVVNPVEYVANSDLLIGKEHHYIADTASQRFQESTNKVRFGARLGLGVSNTNFNKGYPKPETKMDMVWKPSFSAGLILRVPVSKKLTLQQEYLFTYLKGEVKSDAVGYDLSYLSFPVLLVYEAVPKFSFVVGPHFDLLLQAKEEQNGTSTDITHHIEERSIGGVIGVSYRVSDAIHIDGRYAQGINHIGIRQGVLAKEFKTELFQLSICVFPFK